MHRFEIWIGRVWPPGPNVPFVISEKLPRYKPSGKKCNLHMLRLAVAPQLNLLKSPPILLFWALFRQDLSYFPPVFVVTDLSLPERAEHLLKLSKLALGKLEISYFSEIRMEWGGVRKEVHFSSRTLRLAEGRRRKNERKEWISRVKALQGRWHDEEPSHCGKLGSKGRCKIRNMGMREGASSLVPPWEGMKGRDRPETKQRDPSAGWSSPGRARRISLKLPGLLCCHQVFVKLLGKVRPLLSFSSLPTERCSAAVGQLPHPAFSPNSVASLFNVFWGVKTFCPPQRTWASRELWGQSRLHFSFSY